MATPEGVILVVREEGGYGGHNDRYIDLRVDDDPQPIPRLAGLLRLQRLYFDAPRPENILVIAGPIEARLLAALAASGRAVGERWDDAARAALAAVAGVENLEERLLDGDRIDAAVLEHLEARFSG